MKGNSPLDRDICITVFRDLEAQSKDPQYISLREFSEPLLNNRAASKKQLLLFSCCSYDNKRTAKKSLRHDANVRECFCIVGDHDSGTISLTDAAEAIEEAGLAAVLVTTARYTLAVPRWRIITPLSDPLHRDRPNAAGLTLADYPKLVSRLAGTFPVIRFPRSRGRFRSPGTSADSTMRAITGFSCSKATSHLRGTRHETAPSSHYAQSFHRSPVRT
jgi:hypothetical protein